MKNSFFLLPFTILFLLFACDEEPGIIGADSLPYLPMKFTETEMSVGLTPAKQSIVVEFSKVAPTSTGAKHEPVNPIMLTVSDESTAIYGEHYSIANYNEAENAFEIKFDSATSTDGEFSIDLYPDKITETVAIKIMDGFLGMQRMTITLTPEDSE